VLAFSAVALGISTVLGVIAGLAGQGAAAIVHLLFGSPGGVPDRHRPNRLAEMESQSPT
jgi:hypothetical protein